MTYTDSHTHIYASEFDNDLDDMMLRAHQNNVTRLLLPAIDSEYHEKMLRVAGQYPGVCYPMMGLHPTSVKENYADELKIVSEYLANPALKFYAIGEIGIDLYWDKTFEAGQRIAFSRQLDLACEYDLPVVIHTRNSMDIVLEMAEERDDPRIRGVFHCFSGNTGQAERAVRLGFMLGIGGVVTYKNSGLQAVVEHTDLRHLLLETDAPWLPPVPYRGQRNEPAYIPLIAQKIAEIKKVSLEEVAEVTTGNAVRLFGLW
ncbi:MAG: TatD family hydrolase [bacterium]